MTIQSFVLDATAVGTTIGPVNGYIVNFKNTVPPYATLNSADPGYGRTRGLYASELIDIRGTLDYWPWLRLDYADQAPPYLANISQKYLGQLQIVAIPFGAVFTLDLSDVYVPH